MLPRWDPNSPWVSKSQISISVLDNTVPCPHLLYQATGHLSLQLDFPNHISFTFIPSVANGKKCVQKEKLHWCFRTPWWNLRKYWSCVCCMRFPIYTACYFLLFVFFCIWTWWTLHVCASHPSCVCFVLRGCCIYPQKTAKSKVKKGTTSCIKEQHELFGKTSERKKQPDSCITFMWTH